MGSFVDTGLGWYLDEDYLRTLGSVTIGTIASGGGSWGVSPNGTLWIADTTGQGADPDFPDAIYLGYYVESNSSITHCRVKNVTGIPILIALEADRQYRQVMAMAPTQYKADLFNTNDVVVYNNNSMARLGYSGDLFGTYSGYTWLGNAGEEGRTTHSQYTSYLNTREANAQAMAAEYMVTDFGGGSTHTITKVQGGAGAFSIVSYPHDGDVVHVGVGISSIPIPNSAATVAVDGTNGSHNTFNREGMQFTMFYTEQLTGELTSNVPIVTLDTDISGLPGVYEPRLFLAVADAAQIHVGYAPAAEDPYAPGGTSGPGGGTDTDFDITGDTIIDSPLPTFSFANSGFARIYNPDLSQLQRLANYLWTDTNFLQTIVNHAKQLLEDPIESIITLNRLPISVPNGTAEVVKVLFIPTNTSMPPVTNQFVDVDCGTVQIKHEYDSALDYNPYTDISLVLPFIGVVQLDPDEVMDKTLSLTYRVDVVSGMCVAKVAVDGCVLYQYSGNCAISMPFNSADFSNYISAMVTAAKSIAGVAAAGATGAMAAAAEGTGAVKAAVSGAVSGGLESAGPSLSNSSNSTNMFKETFGKGGIGEGTLKAAKKGVANTVGAVVSSKRTIEHAGHFSGNSGFLGVRRPYAIIKRPKMCNPDEYGRFNGRPCMMYLYLGNLSGYTEVQEIHLTGIMATNDELIEIEHLLKSGVIL